MGYKFTYSGVVPDIGDFKNETGTRPGYLFEIAEEDGGVVIQMMAPGKSQSVQHEQGVSHDPSYKGMFIGYKEAQEIVRGLNAAIREAQQKGNGSDLHEDLEVKDKEVSD